VHHVSLSSPKLIPGDLDEPHPKVMAGMVLVALAVLFKENEIRENIKRIIDGGLGKEY